MSVQDYAPKFGRKREHDHGVLDLNDVRPRIGPAVPIPEFLSRQDSKLPKASSLPKALDDLDRELGEFIDNGRMPMHADEDPRQLVVHQPPELLDGLKEIARRLPWLDLKTVVKVALGPDAKPDAIMQAADNVAEWANKNEEPAQ